MVPRADIDRALRDVLGREDALEWAYLFGSALAGEGYRDVDVAVMPAQGAFTRLTDLGRLQVRLSEAAGASIDLVDLRRAPLVLLGSILRSRRVLLDRDRASRHTWEAQTTSRALDYEAAIRRYSDLRREKMRQRKAGAV